LLGTSQWSRVATEQQDLVDEVARVLAADGASVTAIELPAAFDAIWSTAQTLCDVEGALVNAELAAGRPPRISQHTIDLVTRGAAVSALDYLRARRTQRELVEAFAMWMEPFDAVLTTPALGTAPPGLDDTGDAVFCTPASLLGAPAITLPAGSGATGLPLGIQLIDRWGRDRRLLETALWVERALGRAFVFPMP
jgi:amidase